MASVKEIKNRIGSIQDTMKITNAMYMISSSKMQRAKRKLAETEPFFFAQQDAIARMIQLSPDVKSDYFGREEKAKEDRIRGYVVITGDKGLAGAYNMNVIKLAMEKLGESKNNKLFSIGETGRHYFESHGVNIDENFRYTVQDPNLYRAREITSFLLEQYESGELDEIHIVYTKMINAFRMDATTFQLLPMEKDSFHTMEDSTSSVGSEVVEFHPSLKYVLENLIPNIVTGNMYGVLVESYTSEHNSRMMAMQTATDNAKEILHDLGIMYNRVRQAAITQEITEVIAGAKAQKNK